MLLALLFARRNPSDRYADTFVEEHSKRERPCPLCHSVLKQGERVHAVEYPGKPDGMMHIFGCIYCRPEHAQAQRICPVCGKPLAKDAFVVARVFEKGTRKHVHVLGCPLCRRR